MHSRKYLGDMGQRGRNFKRSMRPMTRGIVRRDYRSIHGDLTRLDNMNSLSRFLLIALLILLAAGCASTRHRPKPPTLDDIVQMSTSGMLDAEIIKRIDDSGAIYKLTASDVIKLHERGVSDEVLNYIQREYVDDVRREESYRSYHFYGGFYYPGPYLNFYYGYPLFPHPWYRHRWR